MKNFKEIADKCLAGELSGRFVYRDELHISSFTLSRTGNPLYPYKLYRVGKLTIDGHTPNKYSQNDIIDFIPDNMQKKIEIDVPEGKLPVMEQTENGVVITWKEKELTYDDVCKELRKHRNIIGNPIDNSLSDAFHKKVWTLRKLINIRNYFGKPIDDRGYGIFYHEYYKNYYVDIVGPFNPIQVCFSTKEHAEQAIKMLGDELKYLFEPW